MKRLLAKDVASDRSLLVQRVLAVDGERALVLMVAGARRRDFLWRWMVTDGGSASKLRRRRWRAAAGGGSNDGCVAADDDCLEADGSGDGRWQMATVDGGSIDDGGKWCWWLE